MGLRKALKAFVEAGHDPNFSNTKFDSALVSGYMLAVRRIETILEDHEKKPKLEPAKFYESVPYRIYRLEQRVTSLEHNQNQMLVERSQNDT